MKKLLLASVIAIASAAAMIGPASADSLRLGIGIGPAYDDDYYGGPYYDDPYVYRPTSYILRRWLQAALLHAPPPQLLDRVPQALAQPPPRDREDPHLRAVT